MKQIYLFGVALMGSLALQACSQSDGQTTGSNVD